MLNAAGQALVTLADVSRLAMMFVGIGIGLVVGIMPGLSGTVGMAIVLPFIFGMDPYAALAMLIGMAAVIHTADTFPSVLIGVPGSSGSQATIMDGYPMAQRGEAARALSAAFLSSLFGGLFGALILFLLLPIARPLVLTFGSPELFMLTVLGLAMVGVLSGRRPLLGILAGALGLLIGAIGAAPAVAHYRFTFDTLYLFDGIPIAVVALGLFAVPEMLDLLIARRSVATTASLGKGWLDGAKDVLRERWLVLRCSAIGVAVGSIPGMGGAVVDWISYGQVVQTSKDTSQFGKGDVRGVIAPESSNNAKEGGALIPTLLFGIPGSGTTAVLLGGFVLLGLQPGPRMVTQNLDITLTIVWTLAIANVFGAIACLVLSYPISRLSLIPAERLVPFLLVIMLMGAYQSTRDWGDLVAFLVIGLLGWTMKQVDWPRVPLLIGYVLAINAERYLHLSTSRYGWGWLTHPGVIAIGVLIVVLVLMGVRVRRASVERRPS
jgi:putative tricarboxylic transport membrane protein